MNKQPKPPPPLPPSEPTLRNAVPAVRPPLKSDPNLRAAKDTESLWLAVKNLNEHKAEQVNFNQAVVRHNAKVQAELGELRDVNRKQSEVLDLQTQMLRQIAGALGHPLTRKIVYGVGVLILGWLATKGIRP